MTDQTRTDQSAEIATRADERAKAAQRDISRVEHALTDRIEHLGEAVNDGFDKVFAKLDNLQSQVSKLEAANSNRTAVERLAKWLITIGVTVALAFAGIFFSHGGNPPQH